MVVARSRRLVSRGGGAAAIPFAWSALHDYQRQRILTLIDPSQDPLGSGYHTIQSTIAVGSGGLFGKGWMHGSQTHLDFIPERTTDFIFAVYAEEFGLMGSLLLLGLFLLVIGRGLLITAQAPTLFSRLLAGAITLPEDAIAQSSSRTLRTGQALHARWLSAPVLVRRGDSVTIRARNGGVEVSAAGEALENGKPRQIVRVRNTTTGKVIRARVLEQGLVEPENMGGS